MEDDKYRKTIPNVLEIIPKFEMLYSGYFNIFYLVNIQKIKNCS